MTDRPYSRPAFLIPAGMVFGYMLLFSRSPFPDRIFLAASIAFAVQVAGMFGVVMAGVAANILLGIRGSTDLPSTREMLTGLLLGTAVWILWQFNRESVVLELAPCVERYVSEHGYRPGEAVKACYESRGDSDDFSAD